MYIITKILLTTSWVELIRKKKFATIALDPKDEAFAVYVASISQDSEIYPPRKAQITSLKVDEATISFSPKYTDFINVFFKDLAAKLLEHIGINDNAIHLIIEQPPSYRSIYRLKPVELETLDLY